MSLPTVAAICLTRNRDAMLRRAVRCFERQTYPAYRRMMLIYDTGAEAAKLDNLAANVNHIHCATAHGQPIGTLRNLANSWAASGCVGEIGKPDILMHFDDDDASAPLRIENQVSLLAEPEVGGYNEMLFWDSTPGKSHGAWIYRGAPSYLIGTSLCYWRTTWERKPFPALMTGEDTEWQKGLRSKAQSALAGGMTLLTAAIHGDNTTCRVVWNLDKSGNLRSCKEWRRAPEWDTLAEKVMAL